MRSTGRAIRAALVALTTFAVLGAPAALAAQGSCGSEMGRSYTLALPDAMRTPGLHRFQYRISFVWPDGTPEAFFADNQIEIDPAAPAYRNVLLRLVVNRALLEDRTVELVDSIRPDQAAAFYGQFSSVREDFDIIASATIEVSYEIAPDVWSDWHLLDRSPMRSLCTEVNDGVMRRANGWAS